METRWATKEDFALIPQRRNTTMRGLVLLVGGRPAAIATMFYEGANTVPTCAVDFLDRQAIRPLTLHRFGKAAVAAAQHLGAKRFAALADCTIPRSSAWLERLGLKLIARTEEGGVYLYE